MQSVFAKSFPQFIGGVVNFLRMMPENSSGQAQRRERVDSLPDVSKLLFFRKTMILRGARA